MLTVTLEAVSDTPQLLFDFVETSQDFPVQVQVPCVGACPLEPERLGAREHVSAKFLGQSGDIDLQVRDGSTVGPRRVTVEE